jgi:NADH-quinone oxidoreductase subunit M
MLRFALPLFPGPAADWRDFFIVLGLIGLLWSSLVAFRQPDSRGVIAYSSIAQMSFITVGIFVLNDPGGTGATFQMVNHGLISVTLFLLAGFVEVRFGSGLFGRIGALAHGRPALATIVLTIGVVNLAVPGSNLFASEFLLLLGGFRRNWLIGTLASLAIVLAAMYMLRWISAVLHDRPLDPVGLREAADPLAFPDVRWEAVYLVPLIAAVLTLSASPYLVTHRVSDAVHALTAPAALEAGR